MRTSHITGIWRAPRVRKTRRCNDLVAGREMGQQRVRLMMFWPAQTAVCVWVCVRINTSTEQHVYILSDLPSSLHWVMPHQFRITNTTPEDVKIISTGTLQKALQIWKSAENSTKLCRISSLIIRISSLISVCIQNHKKRFASYCTIYLNK